MARRLQSARRACIPLEATCPILRSPAAVGDGPDCDYGFLFGIDDGKRESPEQEPSGVVLSHRPAFRGFADRVSGSMQFFDEVHGCFGAALLIPSDCALNICDRGLVVLNTLSAPSPWPRARDAVLPKGRSLPCPLSGLRFDVPLPHPKPLGQIHSYSQDCRAGCWLMQRARQRRGRAPVLEDRKFPDSWPYFTPCSGESCRGEPRERRVNELVLRIIWLPNPPPIATC